jgi:hypothetical protein
MRAKSLSRVTNAPSLLPAERIAIYGQPMVIPEEDWQQAAPQEPWISRPLELGVSFLGLMTVAFMGAMLWTSPSNLDFVESAWMVTCGLSGFVIWFLPQPSQNLRTFRLLSWAALGLALFFIGPMPLVRARWTQDLSSSDTVRKERAVVNLVRAGYRNLSKKNLGGLRLIAQDLSSVQFTGTSLRGADLSRSMIRESIFDNADLENANVAGADLGLARLNNAKGLRSLKCDHKTKFPDGFYCRRGLTRVRKK